MTTATAVPDDQSRRYTTCIQCRKLVRVHSVVMVEDESWCSDCWLVASDDEEHEA